MGNKYSCSEFIKTVYSLVLTKLSLPQSRLIRRPIYMRGRKSIVGCVGLTTGRLCRFDLDGIKKTLFIGKNCEMGDMTHIVAHSKVKIGNNVLIASKCFISDTNHGEYKRDQQDSPHTPPNKRKLISKPVKIGNNVWIGENVVILAGAEIGDGCIIGANSIVSKHIKDNSMVIGNNRVIKMYNEQLNRWEKTR